MNAMNIRCDHLLPNGSFSIKRSIFGDDGYCIKCGRHYSSKDIKAIKYIKRYSKIELSGDMLDCIIEGIDIEKLIKEESNARACEKYV